MFELGIYNQNDNEKLQKYLEQSWFLFWTYQIQRSRSRHSSLGNEYLNIIYKSQSDVREMWQFSTYIHFGPTHNPPLRLAKT